MADNGFNLATLWVPVVPETSQVGPAMEQAGKEAKGKFGAAVKDFGKTIHDDLDKIGQKTKDSFSNAGKHAKDAFSHAGKTAGEAFNSELGKELQSTVGNEIGKAVGDAVKEMPMFKTAAEYVGAFTRATDAASSSLGSVRDTLTSIKSHDAAGALAGVETTLRNIEPIAKQFGTDISDWHVPSPLLEGLQKADGTSHDLIKNFADAKGGIDKLGESGGGLSGLIGKLGELGTIATAVVASLNSIKDADHWLEDKMPWYRSLDQQFKNNPINRFFHDTFGSTPNGPSATTDANGQPLFRSGTTGSQMPDHPTDEWDPTWGPRPADGGLGWFGHGLPRPPSPPAMPEPVPTPPTPATSSPSLSVGGSGSSIGGGDLSSRVVGGVSDRRSLTAAGSRVANLLAFAQSLSGTPYSQALRNDCSGMVAKLANVALGLPPSASFTTVNEGDWLFSHGFQPGLGGPNDLNIGWYDHGGGNRGHTAATLPGGIHAESGGSHGNFLVGPGAAGAEDPQFTQHAHLSMGGANGMPGAGGPVGSKSDPVYVSSADGGGSSGDSGGPWESQGQQLGQGLVNGIAQMFGVDGSVFKGFGSGKGILDFGAVKLGGGLLNWGMHMAQARNSMGAGSSTNGMGMATGGDGASIPGLAMLQGLGQNISAAARAAGPGAPSGPGTGGTTVNIHGDVNSGFNVTQHGVQDGVGSWKEQYNAQPQRYASQGIVPNSGGGPAI